MPRPRRTQMSVELLLISPISIITAVVSFGVHSFVDKEYGVMMLFRLKTMTIAELGKLFHGHVETLQEFTPEFR